MRKYTFFLSTIFFLTISSMAFAASVPQLTSAVGRELDRQVVASFSLGESPAQGVSLMLTTPVNINNLEETNPLARQVQEELARWFVQAGYEVNEIRKGADILFDQEYGEMLLTRRAEMVSSEEPQSTLVLAGTYVVTSKNVRFNIRLVRTNSLQTVAMSTITMPITSEVASLLSENTHGVIGMAIQPTVLTTLP